MRALPVAAVVGLLAASPATAQERFQVPMRDGVKLSTTVWLPGKEACPVVLTRGYSPAGLGGSAAKFNRAGYAFVSQQCRGGGGDDGTRFFPDDTDGYDCIEWIARQPWCDGKVAMWGGSYWGATQWRAAVARPPALKAIVPGYMDADYWKAGYWGTGALHLKMTAQGRVTRGNYPLEKWKSILLYLPLIDLDRHVTGRENKLWNDYIRHSSFDEYWKTISMRHDDKWKKISIPVYCVSGWRDYYPGVALENFRSVKETGLSPDVRVRIGDHGHSGAPDVTDTLRFLDHHLRGKDTGIAAEPPIKIQVRHGGWRLEKEWPPEGTDFRKYYFSSPDGSRSGRLVRRPPEDEIPTEYVYDPKDPVPTLGANGSHTSPEVPGLIVAGPVDQRPNERRRDVLVYSTPPLEHDLHVIGPVEVVLHAASSARDTDFTARLIDVHPDGRALNISEGIVRARFRESIWKPPTLISPGRVYEYRIELLPVSIVFRKGHRLRIHISSSNWPLWDRNLNTGNPIGLDAEIRIARQTVYHDGERRSHLLLPLAPPPRR